MNQKQNWYNITILILCAIAIVGFLYFGWYGDPIANFQSGDLFPTNSWFTPCDMCIVARILTAIIVILALIMRVYRRYSSSLFLAIFFVWLFGLLMEVYQYYLQMGVWWGNLFFCDPNVPCSRIDVIYAGFITIPFMALVFFFIVSILARCGYRSRNHLTATRDVL